MSIFWPHKFISPLRSNLQNLLKIRRRDFQLESFRACLGSKSTDNNACEIKTLISATRVEAFEMDYSRVKLEKFASKKKSAKLKGQASNHGIHSTLQEKNEGIIS